MINGYIQTAPHSDRPCKHYSHATPATSVGITPQLASGSILGPILSYGGGGESLAVLVPVRCWGPRWVTIWLATPTRSNGTSLAIASFVDRKDEEWQHCIRFLTNYRPIPLHEGYDTLPWRDSNEMDVDAASNLPQPPASLPAHAPASPPAAAAASDDIEMSPPATQVTPQHAPAADDDEPVITSVTLSTNVTDAIKTMINMAVEDGRITRSEGDEWQTAADTTSSATRLTQVKSVLDYQQNDSQSALLDIVNHENRRA